MSYDLFLKPKKGGFPLEKFVSYFDGRKNYSIEGEQAWYQNDDTGVYFVFDYQGESDDVEEDYPVAFNMNYFRPTFFVKEAEPEVRSFIEFFDMSVDDPQVDGMGVGEYVPGKFTSGWLHGNEFGYKAILKDHTDVISLPTKQLENAWAWNFQKQQLQEQITEDVFVPTIMLLIFNGLPVTACVWPDAIPSVIPKVDILLIGRKELARRKLFKKVEDMAIGMWNEFEHLLDKYKSQVMAGGYCLNYSSPPSELIKVIKSLDSINVSDLERLGQDQVLDKELVDKFML